MQVLNFNEQLRFCTFNIQINIVNFDPRARTYEEKNICCTFGLVKDIIMKYEGTKHKGEVNCSFGRDGGVADCKSKDRGRRN